MLEKAIVAFFDHAEQEACNVERSTIDGVVMEDTPVPRVLDHFDHAYRLSKMRLWSRDVARWCR